MEEFNWQQAQEADIEPVKSAKKRKRTFFDIIFDQAIYYIIVLIIFFGFKFFGGDAYSAFKGELSDKLKQTTSTDTVLDEIEDEKSEAEDAKGEINDLPATNISVDSTDPYAEYDEESDEACIFDLSEVRLLSSNKHSVNSMYMPVNSTNVTSLFGYRINPITGNFGMHSGIDIGANMGDNIYAALDGVVVKSKQSSDYGKFITVDHGDGLVTLYAHCSKLLVDEGDTVKKGQVIALAGSTGRSNGPHLHFEVRINGIRIDPQHFLTKLYSA